MHNRVTGMQCSRISTRSQALKFASQARLDLYKRKVAKVESEKWLQEHKPSLTVDVAGANRFISAAIPELRPEQKQALSKVRSTCFDLLEGHIPYVARCTSTLHQQLYHHRSICSLGAGCGQGR